MFERYTEKARRIIFFARYEASGFGDFYIETEHLLLGLIREDKMLVRCFVGNESTFDEIRKQVEAHQPVHEKISVSIDLPLSQACKRVLAFASEEAERLSHKHIGPEHLLLGLLREETGFAAQILHARGLQLSKVREGILHWQSDVSARYRSPEVNNLEIARQYLKAIENGADSVILAGFFDSIAVQRDYPNQFSPQGMNRWLPSIRETAEQNRTTFKSQEYTILHEMSSGKRVLLEVLWKGTLAVSWQGMASGSTICAHIALVFEFQNGKIIELRNYSCFEPFSGEQTQE